MILDGIAGIQFIFQREEICSFYNLFYLFILPTSNLPYAYIYELLKWDSTKINFMKKILVKSLIFLLTSLFKVCFGGMRQEPA
jgi:hypothetical protein